MASQHESASPFTAIADPTRRQLLELLSLGEMTVQEMAAQFEVTLSAISQHLRILRFAGLVSEERRGRNRVYRLEPEQLSEIEQWVTRSVTAFWQRKLSALGTALSRTTQP